MLEVEAIPQSLLLVESFVLRENIGVVKNKIDFEI
jgi:hypothetical protein